MSDILAGHYMPANSVFHHMNVVIKLFSFFLLLIAVILTDSFGGYLLTAFFLIVLVLCSGIGWKQATGSVRNLWLFFVVIFLMNTVFFESRQILYSWWIFHISVGGMIQGAKIVLRVIVLMILGNILTCTTTPLEITYGMERMIWPLKFIGVPIRDVAMILGVALQFIPVFLEECDMIKKAQTARGARFESLRFRDRAKSVLPLVVPVFLSAFRRADELSIAMEARGYRRTKGRTRRRNADFHWKDMIALAVSCMFCVIQIIL